MNALFLAAVVLLVSFGCVQQQAQSPEQGYLKTVPETGIDAVGKTENTACFSSGECIGLEIARTEEERARGLMFRQELDYNKGMLFVFEEPENYSFWMKNTLIPLDIIWIGRNEKIVQIEKAVPCTQEPCKIYSPKGNALWVLETNQGFAEKNSLQEGQKVFLNYK